MSIEVQLARVKQIQAYLHTLEENLEQLQTTLLGMPCGEVSFSQKTGFREPIVGWDDRIHCTDIDMEEIASSNNLNIVQNCTNRAKPSLSCTARVHVAKSRLARGRSSHESCVENTARPTDIQGNQSFIRVAGDEGRKHSAKRAMVCHPRTGTRGGLVKKYMDDEVASLSCQTSDKLVDNKAVRQKAPAKQVHEQDHRPENSSILAPDERPVCKIAGGAVMERQRCFRGLSWTRRSVVNGNSLSEAGKEGDHLKNGQAEEHNGSIEVKDTFDKVVAYIDTRTQTVSPVMLSIANQSDQDDERL